MLIWFKYDDYVNPEDCSSLGPSQGGPQGGLGGPLRHPLTLLLPAFLCRSCRHCCRPLPTSCLHIHSIWAYSFSIHSYCDMSLFVILWFWVFSLFPIEMTWVSKCNQYIITLILGFLRCIFSGAIYRLQCICYCLTKNGKFEWKQYTVWVWWYDTDKSVCSWMVQSCFPCVMRLCVCSSVLSIFIDFVNYLWS